MKSFQPIFLLFLAILATLSTSTAQDCDAICNERVQQAIQPIQEEKVRAEEWGHGVRRELDEAYNRLRTAEEQVEQFRNLAGEKERQAADFERTATDLRGNMETAHRELEGARNEIQNIKNNHQGEVDGLRTKAEEATRSLGRVQFALDEANDKINELEGARISVNLKGIADDVKGYWKNLLTWWTGLVVPDKKKDEDL